MTLQIWRASTLCRVLPCFLSIPENLSNCSSDGDCQTECVAELVACMHNRCGRLKKSDDVKTLLNSVDLSYLSKPQFQNPKRSCLLYPRQLIDCVFFRHLRQNEFEQLLKRHDKNAITRFIEEHPQFIAGRLWGRSNNQWHKLLEKGNYKQIITAGKTAKPSLRIKTKDGRLPLFIFLGRWHSIYNENSLTKASGSLEHYTRECLLDLGYFKDNVHETEITYGGKYRKILESILPFISDSSTLKVTDKNGSNPLHYCFVNGVFNTVLYNVLLEIGFDENVKNKFGVTPRELRRGGGDERKVSVFKQLGATVALRRLQQEQNARIVAEH